MNTYTNRSDFTESAQHILDHSDLLIKSDCCIIDDVLYERCLADDKLYSETQYRFFFNSDDYDYVENNKELTDKIDSLLNKKESE